MEFDGSKHLILKEDDIVGILETDDVKDLQPLNDRVLIKVGHLRPPVLVCNVSNVSIVSCLSIAALIFPFFFLF